MYNREYFPPPPPEEVLHEENYFPPPGPEGILTRREGVAQGDMEDQVPHPYRFFDLMRAGGITIRLLAIAPPRRSPFAPYILAEVIQPGVKLPSLSEYNRASDPQDHLDRFLARADLLDINDVAYCKLLQTTLSGKIMAWFNQLPPGTIEAFEQLSHHFPHHFAINKLYPKTASYLFTIIQKENESLREYVKRFSKAVLEVPHVNLKLLASIMQQNLKIGRFKESITGKPLAIQEELLIRPEKYIRIEESIGSRSITPSKRRKSEEEETYSPR
ncbi:UNVERIFIED_CONTAM: hypothetical protein Sradi_6829500 [Sesamum radiatum]|uniref:Retrotransposon gag domain-containing protein n=1 Tax=Sesamum radiatum TaxID=300843 RepID=A0AAW2JUB4_SESRA